MQEAKRINELNRVNLEYNIDHSRSENGSKEREGHTEGKYKSYDFLNDGQ